MDFLHFLFPNFFLKRAIKKLAKDIESGLLDSFIDGLLVIMKLLFIVDGEFRKNIEGFNARYSFKSRDGKIASSVIFTNNKMIPEPEEIANTDVTVIFKDSKALKEFIFNENPDIIGAILDNNISYEGNLNYLAKFAYMAKHLQLNYLP